MDKFYKTGRGVLIKNKIRITTEEMIFEDEYEIISVADYKLIDSFHKHGTKLQINCNQSESSVLSFTNAIRSILSNHNFKKDYFKRRKLYLCEAYCLLWQTSGNTDLDRVSYSRQLKTGAYAAILIDLYAFGKINITENNKKLCGYDPKNTSQLIVEIVDTEPTFTFMDRAVFNDILRHYEYSKGTVRPLEEWLNTAEDLRCVNSCLDNLISRGILGSSYTNVFGNFHKHAIMNIGPEQDLERELKAVCLREKRPDSYMLSLMTLSLISENTYSYVDVILEKYFTKKECKVAKENIRMIVDTQGVVLKSPKFTRKKFSVEIPQNAVTNTQQQGKPLSPIPASPR